MEYEKSFRFMILCMVVIILGVLYFLFKVEACKSTPETCKDEFHAFSDGFHTKTTCQVGAVAEVVTSPPAPKTGILCHCVKEAGPGITSHNK